MACSLWLMVEAGNAEPGCENQRWCPIVTAVFSRWWQFKEDSRGIICSKVKRGTLGLCLCPAQGES